MVFVVWRFAVWAAVVAAGPTPAAPNPGCVYPHGNLSFCNISLPVAIRARLLAAMMTAEELISQMVDHQPNISRLGVNQPYTYGVEALHGVAASCPFPGAGGRCFTSFATSSASAASFNRSLWHRMGKAQGDEARWAYDHGYLPGLHLRGPQLNPQRDPRWGRNDNSPGEDAYLQGEYGAAVVRGGQGAHPNGTYPFGEYRKAIHEMKHFTMYSVENGRNQRGDSWDIGLRDLAEYYFVPLKACIDQADVGAFMCSYNAVNGTAACGDQWMIGGVVRDHWGWDGAVESDCGAVEGISSHRHGGYAEASVETATAALNATVSVDCNDPSHNAYTKRLGQALAANLVDRDQLVTAVARIYKGRFQTGEFDPDHTMYRDLPDDTIGSAAHQQLSLETAEQSIVLLRNDLSASGLARLPLKPGRKLAVIGPNANSTSVFVGSYGGMACPAFEPNVTSRSKNRNMSCIPTAFGEIARLNTGGTTVCVAGCSLDTDQGEEPRDHTAGTQTCSALVDLARLNASVAAADVVVLVLGTALQITNGEGMDRPWGGDGYTLPGKQNELVELVASFGKPTIMVLLSGAAVGIDFAATQTTWPIVVPGLGGKHGAVALARTLFGQVSPSGKLPYTIYPQGWAAATPMSDMSLTAGQGRTYKWYGYANSDSSTGNHDNHGNTTVGNHGNTTVDDHGNTTVGAAPTFAFGTGVSYTTFKVAVADVRNDPDTPAADTPAAAAAAAEVATAGPDASPRGPVPSLGDTVLRSFSVTTTNTGAEFTASDATLVYIVPTPGNLSAAAPSLLPRKQLVNFVRTPPLAPGGSFTATVAIRLRDLAMATFGGATVAFQGGYGVLFSNGAGAETTLTVTVPADQTLDQLPLPPGFRN